ncbi:zinc-dependent alcohol dehydrogenase [Shumkonia mesophila]|uniref:zinc-dependent alcohol dehydrogenase n=1 Tax=Shumkonia mesophila TaxID=2838854 RepID=UPI002934765E|nr:zinc-binding alcohol dehydrogenase [Shumkonia mesophila]
MPAGRGLWYVSKGAVALRPAEMSPRDDARLLIRALFSGVSRGTERLVMSGMVPPSEHARMRCPHQAGDFPFPVQYGYALVGVVEEGPADRLGQAVFVLHPHQDRICIPVTEARPLPPGLPPRRAVLAANMETALNVVWDARIAPGDNVLVVGGGVVGLLVAGLAARIAGTRVTVADVDPSRAPVAARLGVAFALPAEAPGEQDVVVHASASEDGLRLALACAGLEATVVEASWFGAAAVSLPLGEAFHSRRLRIVSSQVGAVPANRRARWTHARRLDTALGLLLDAAFDELIAGEIAFADAPARLPVALAAGSGGLMTVLTYA